MAKQFANYLDNFSCPIINKVQNPPPTINNYKPN